MEELIDEANVPKARLLNLTIHIDRTLNGDHGDRSTAFILLLVPIDGAGGPEKVIVASSGVSLEEQIEIFKGQLALLELRQSGVDRARMN